MSSALGAQATLVFDQGNRVSLAGDTAVIVREPREKSISADGVSVSYDTGKTGDGLAATTWGQQAVALDTSGTLAALSAGAKPRAQLRVFR